MSLFLIERQFADELQLDAASAAAIKLVNDASGVVTYALIFGALAVVGLTLACTRDSSGWLNRPPPQPAPPYGR